MEELDPAEPLKRKSRRGEGYQCMKLGDYFLRYVGKKIIETKPAVIFDSGKGLIEELTYSELDCGANRVESILRKLFNFESNTFPNKTQHFIGVHCSPGRLYPVLILGILRTGLAFYNLENFDESLADGVTNLNLVYILTESCVESVNGFVHLENVSISELLNLSCQIYKVAQCGSKATYIPEEIAYAIQTSGTTGRKKTVLVPHSCISPNIYDFSGNIWNLSSDDVIFGSSPPTFDPHIVELFSVLASGATIVYTTSTVKLSSKLLANLLLFHEVTVMQITPSLFRRLFSFQSEISLPKLKAIALGGEKFPGEEVREAQKSFPFLENVTFQNIYGVTEVSCWASVATVDTKSLEPVSIGRPLEDTELTVDSEPEGEIIIKSNTRKCLIIDPCGNISHSEVYRTGDLGVNTVRGIVCRGRNDKIVKRNGMKICLDKIEESARSLENVRFAECVVNEGKIFLLVKFKCNSGYSESNRMYLKRNLSLPLYMYPDKIICLDEDTVVPMNNNGKLDFKFVLRKSSHTHFYQEFLTGKSEVRLQQVKELVKPIWETCTSHQILNGNGDSWGSFAEMGGTSVSATRLIESVFMALNLFGSKAHVKWEPKLLSHLLGEDDGTFESFVKVIAQAFREASPLGESITQLDSDLLSEVQPELPKISGASCENSKFIKEFEEYMIESKYEVFSSLKELGKPKETFVSMPPTPSEFYRFPMALCVDATVSVVTTKNLAIIGCHGGMLLCLALNILKSNPNVPLKAICWKIQLPNRIEASVEIASDDLHVYVSCHDGKLYKISVITGNIVCWAESSNPNGIGYAPIRSKCVASSKFVIFIDAQNTVHCLNSHTLNKIWTNQSFKLLATVVPVIFRRICILPTLDHEVIGIDVKTGMLLWTTSDASTDLIYSSPTLVTFKESATHNASFAYFTSTKGIEARNPKTGMLKWRRTTQSMPPFVPPLFCNFHRKLVWIYGTTLHILCPETGETLGSHFVGICASPTLICFETQCFLFYKVSRELNGFPVQPKIVFVNLDEVERKYYEQESLCQVPSKCDCAKEYDFCNTTDFQTFSMPMYHLGFIMLGGRDNNLHVIMLKLQ